MKTILIIFFVILAAGMVEAQQQISSNGILQGYINEEEGFSNYLIQFKKNGSYKLYQLNAAKEKAVKTKGTWSLEGETLYLTDKKTGKQNLKLEKQKGDWYLLDAKRIYTFKGKFSTYSKHPKKGAGC